MDVVICTIKNFSIWTLMTSDGSKHSHLIVKNKKKAIVNGWCLKSVAKLRTTQDHLHRLTCLHQDCHVDHLTPVYNVPTLVVPRHAREAPSTGGGLGMTGSELGK